MANIFDTIEDKRELDQLLKELRAIHRNLVDVRDTARHIITRRIKQPEFVRTINRKLFPQFQQMVIEIREQIAEVKEQRTNVQRNQNDSRVNDNSTVARPDSDEGRTPRSGEEAE